MRANVINWSPPWNRLSRRHESAANKWLHIEPSPAGARASAFLPRFSCLWNAIAAQEQGYVQRQVVTTNGAITFVGNSLGLNKQAERRTGRERQEASARSSPPTRVCWTINWPDGTTANFRLNSSSAVLSLPSGSRVIHAELIWGGSHRPRRDDVSRIPGRAGHLHHTGRNNTGDARSNDRRHAIRFPAELLRPHSERHGPRQRRGKRHVHGWSCSRDAGDDETFNAAGWTLAILYENFDLPPRSLSLFLGLEPQGGAIASVSGFCTPDEQRTSCGRAWP